MLPLSLVVEKGDSKQRYPTYDSKGRSLDRPSKKYHSSYREEVAYDAFKAVKLEFQSSEEYANYYKEMLEKGITKGNSDSNWLRDVDKIYIIKNMKSKKVLTPSITPATPSKSPTKNPSR